MERMLGMVRDLVAALDLKSKVEEIEAGARELLTRHDGTVGEDQVALQRLENKALAACYLAANNAVLPARVSYDDLRKAAATLPSWKGEVVPSKNGTMKLVKRFTRRICIVDHDPVIIERAGLSFTICKQCHTVLHSGGKVGGTQVEEGELAWPEAAVKESGLDKDASGTIARLDVEEQLDGDIPAQETSAESEPQKSEKKSALKKKGKQRATPLAASTPASNDDAELENDLENELALSSTEPDTRGKWLASAATQAKKMAKELPILKPAVPGAIALLKRSIDAFISGDKVSGSTVIKIVKMALLHECKVMDIPITTKDFNVPPSEYLQFLASTSASVTQTSATSDEAIVEQALKAIAAYQGAPVDMATQERVTRFQTVARRKLMGFSPAMASGVLAFIDLARNNPDVVLSKVASIAGSNTSSLYNATNRFLDKIGRPGDPAASIVEKVRAAFPPRD